MPPPPVSGADVGKLELAAGVCVAAGVDGSSVVTPGLADGLADADAEADAEADADADVDARAEVEAPAEPDADALLPCVADALFPCVADAVADVLADDEVPSVPDCELDKLVWGVGVKVDEAPPPVEQAETATATRKAPAAQRPAISHAPWGAPGLVRRIFTNLLLECVSDKFDFSANMPLSARRTSPLSASNLVDNAFPGRRRSIIEASNKRANNPHATPGRA